jgi:hypothetical protein
MGFEKIVLNEIDGYLESGECAQFVGGSLFVTCSPKTASEIKTVLNDMNFGGIIVTPIGAPAREFAYDFV